MARKPKVINVKKKGPAVSKKIYPITMKKLQQVMDEMYNEQFDEDTVPVDIGDVVKLLYLIVDNMVKLESKIDELKGNNRDD